MDENARAQIAAMAMAIRALLRATASPADVMRELDFVAASAQLQALQSGDEPMPDALRSALDTLRADLEHPR